MTDEKFHLGRFVYSWLRVERVVLLFTLVSLILDDFQTQYGDKAYTVLIAHLLVIVLCCFADCIKQKINSIAAMKVAGVEVNMNSKNDSS